MAISEDEAIQDELRLLLEVWETEQENEQFDPDDTLRRVCEMIESAMNVFLCNNPDPMDERHPIKALPQCRYGHLLKIILRVENFVSKLVISYLMCRDNIQRNVLAARLLISLLPGLDTHDVFSEADDLFPQLFRWAEKSESRELCAYSMALLGAAMDAEQAHQYKTNNAALIPIALANLKKLYNEMSENYKNRDLEEEKKLEQTDGPTNFAGVLDDSSSAVEKGDTSKEEIEENTQMNGNLKIVIPPPQEESTLRVNLPIKTAPWDEGGFDSSFVEKIDEINERKRRKSEPLNVNREVKRQKLMPNNAKEELRNSKASTKNTLDSFSNLLSPTNSINNGGLNGGIFDASYGASNSSWRTTMHPIVVGTHKLYPLSIEMEQRLILHYLIPTCEYQDNLSIILEHRALDVIHNYLSHNGCLDIRLLFDSIKYVSSLLIHRKFAWDFIAENGIEKLLIVNQHSMASAAVATCLFYLAYSTDIMEKVCQLSDSLLNKIVDYALWLLDHSYESGRASASMFFAYSLKFRAILDRFDARDGLRRLYNYISTLTILQENEDTDLSISDENYMQSNMTIKNAICAFRVYLASHIFIKIEHLKRSKHNSNGLSIPSVIPNNVHPHSKAMTLDLDTEMECINYLIQTQSLLTAHHSQWRPIEDMRSLGVFRLILILLSCIPDWNHNAKMDTMKLILELVRIATVSPKIQLDFCETIHIKKVPIQGIRIILELAEGEIISDAQIQQLALETVVNCLCGSTNTGGGLYYRVDQIGRSLLPPEILNPGKENTLLQRPNNKSQVFKAPLTSTDQKCQPSNQRVFLSSANILYIVWSCAQQNNAIMVLISLLHIKVPPTDADLLRELACRALAGIASHNSVRQILSKLPLIAASELNALMQEPVLLEKRQEHSRFCEQARLLLERVTLTKITTDFPKDITQEKLWKSSVVAQTRIVYNEKELLQLMCQHLVDIGFNKTAVMLQEEAKLPNVPASRLSITPASLSQFPRRNPNAFVSISTNHTSPTTFNTYSTTTTKKQFATPNSATTCSLRKQQNSGKKNLTNSLSIGTTPSTSSISFSSSNSSSSSTTLKRKKSLKVGVDRTDSIFPIKSSISNSSQFSLQVKPHKALGEIITEYFRKQHASCRNPVATCPPFSLFYPHKCPQPKQMYSAPTNFVKRFMSRSIPHYKCSPEMYLQADRRQVFSRFKHWKSFSEENETFTCCSFSRNDEYMLLGSYTGDLFWFNLRTGEQDSTTSCHHSALTSIQQAIVDPSLMLTSSAFVKPYSVLWRIGETQEQLFEFDEEVYVDFGPRSTEHLIATQGPKATIYDTETGNPIVRLYDEGLANDYVKNRACFDPNNELVLNDGILFDPRINASGRVVHKFDKLNNDISGVFHPRGYEVIINSEVWDLRTRRLMYSIPALNNSRISFNSTGDIIFGLVYEQHDSMDDRIIQMYNSSFRTLDAANYQVITTMDMKKQLVDFCVDNSDNYIGILETNRVNEDDANLCKIYEIGRKREADDDDEVGEEQNEDDEDEDDVYSTSNNSSSSEDHYSSDDDENTSSNYDGLEDDDEEEDEGEDEIDDENINGLEFGSEEDDAEFDEFWNVEEGEGDNSSSIEEPAENEEEHTTN